MGLGLDFSYSTRDSLHCTGMPKLVLRLFVERNSPKFGHEKRLGYAAQPEYMDGLYYVTFFEIVCAILDAGRDAFIKEVDLIELCHKAARVACPLKHPDDLYQEVKSILWFVEHTDVLYGEDVEPRNLAVAWIDRKASDAHGW